MRNCHVNPVTAGQLAAAVVACTCVCACESVSSDGNTHTLTNVRELRLVEELRLGSVNNPDSGFSRIGTVAVDADRNVYVLEGQDREIRVFSPDGVYLRTIGRRGEGPGEFANPELIGFLGDTLWVNDPQLARITLFNPDGAVLATLRGVRSVRLTTPVSSGLAFARGGIMRTDGFLHLEAPSAVVLLQGAGSASDSISVPILRFDRNGNLVDTLDHVSLYVIPSNDQGQLGRPAQTDMVLDPGPPADTPLRLFIDGGRILIDRAAAASASSAAFSVTRTTISGDTVFHRNYRYAPAVLTETLRDSLSASPGHQNLRAFQPPVSAAHAGADGSIWLRRELLPGPRQVWLILDDEGAPLGHVQLPLAAAIRWVNADVTYVVERDEFDVPWLVRYRVSGS